MSQILSKEQIRSLYGVTGKGEVVAFGASIKHTNPGRTNKRQFTHEQLMKFRPKNAPQPIIESEVIEIL